MAEKELAIIIRAKDLATRGIRGVKKELGGLDGVSKTVGKGLSNAGRNLEKIAVIAAGTAVAGIGASVKMASDFEAQLNIINTVAKATPEGLTAIGDSMRALARETGTPLEDLTAAYYDLVSAGIKTADAQKVLTAANTLAIGGLATTAESVDLLTTAINSYGGDASKAGQYADQFAQAINAGKVTTAEIAASFAQVGPMAAAMGIGVDEISAGLAQMTAKGTPAAEALTQMRSAMVALQRQTPEMKRVLKELGIADAELYADTYGLVPLYDKLRKKADELGIPLIKLTGRVEGTQFALQNTGDAFDDYNANLEKVRDSSGEAADQMSERQKGFAYQMARLKANVKDAGITIGTALLPALGELAAKATAWATTHQDDIKRFAEDLATGFKGAVEWASRLDWDAIAGTLKSVAGVGKTILETFLRMPSWVQVAVVSGWGLNKLTGGALGTLVGQLASGLIKGVLGINAGVVNVRGAVVNGPGGGVGGGGGALPVAGPVGWGPAIWSSAGKLLAGSFVAWAGLQIGGMIGGPIYDASVQPAKDYKNRQVDRIAASGDPEKIQTGIDKLTDEIAFWEKKAPDVRETMAPLIQQLKDDRERLERAMARVPTSLIVDAARRDSKNNAAAAQREANMRAQARQQHQENVAQARVVAAKVEAQRASTDRGFSASNAQLGVIARKPFSATVNVTNHLNVRTFISGTSVMKEVRLIQSSRATTQPGGSGFQPEYQG